MMAYSQIKSDYFIRLTGETANRYKIKISVINNCDPYCLNESDLCKNFEKFPTVEMIDLVNYLILSHSFYTGAQLKAYKSLQAFKFYEAGFVQVLGYRKIDTYFVVVAKVKHSQKMNEVSLNVWVIVSEDGSVSSAHCTCVAGLGEVCSHVASVLFALHARNILVEASCTDELALWPVPSNSTAPMSRVCDMAWSSSSPAKMNNDVPPLAGDTLVSFLRKVQEASPGAPILRIYEPFASEIACSNETNENMKLPAVLTELFNPELQNQPLESLLPIINDIVIDLSEEECEAVCKITISQCKSSNWFKFRAGRITASNFKSVCRTSLQKPSLSVIKGICYPEKNFFFQKLQIMVYVMKKMH